MTTIILVTIGILLAAAAALFTIFYGGSAFTGGSDKAQADALHNAGLNVVSAYELYRSTTDSAPGDVPALISAKALKERPSLGSIGQADDAFRSFTVSGRQVSAYVVKNVSNGVCRRVNHDMGAAEAPAADPAGKFGCITSATQAEGNLYYAEVDAPSGAGGLTQTAAYTFPNYVTCGYENGTCTVAGTHDVRYGANGNYITKTVTGSIGCDNGTFGGDPAYGTAKTCQYLDGTYSLTNPPAQPTGDGSQADYARQAGWIMWAASQAPVLAAHGQKDEVPVGDGIFWGGNVLNNQITSTLYKPYGGKFSSGAYITFYIQSQPYEPFCVYWQSISHPGMSNCDNWYGNHIVLYL